VSVSLSKRVATIRVVRGIAGLGLRLAIAVLRVVIGLPVMANVVRSRRVAMLRVGRAVIAGRVLRLATAALRVAIVPPATANVVRSKPAKIRAAQAAIARLALRSTSVARLAAIATTRTMAARARRPPIANGLRATAHT